MSQWTDEEFSEEEEEEEEEEECGRKNFKEDVHEGKTIFVRSVLTLRVWLPLGMTDLLCIYTYAKVPITQPPSLGLVDL